MRLNQVKRCFGIFLLFVLVAASGTAADFDHILSVLEEIDQRSNFVDVDFAAMITMITEDPEQGLERTVARQFRRDLEDQFVLVIQEPSTQRGQGYLMDGDNLWFYDPSSRQFAHTSLKEAFQDSDARNADFSAWSFSTDYNVENYTTGTLGVNEVYIIDLAARHDGVTYPYLTIYVTIDSSLLLKAEEFSLNRRLMRTALFPSYARVGDNIIPRQMLFIDELVEGKRTQITLAELSVQPIPDYVFTRAYLEQVSR